MLEAAPGQFTTSGKVLGRAGRRARGRKLHQTCMAHAQSHAFLTSWHDRIVIEPAASCCLGRRLPHQPATRYSPPPPLANIFPIQERDATRAAVDAKTSHSQLGLELWTVASAADTAASWGRAPGVGGKREGLCRCGPCFCCCCCLFFVSRNPKRAQINIERSNPSKAHSSNTTWYYIDTV